MPSPPYPPFGDVVVESTRFMRRTWVEFIRQIVNWINDADGAWVVPTLASGDFTTDNATAWTIGISTVTYKVRGKSVTVTISLTGNTLAAGGPTALIVTLPVALLPANDVGTAAWASNGGTGEAALMKAVDNAGAAQIQFQRANLSAWTAGAGNNSVIGTIEYEVA